MANPQPTPQKHSISTDPARPGWYGFDRFRVDTRSNRLFAVDERLEVKPKAVALLTLLISNRDRVVTRQELMDGLWPDRFVTEANLSQHVFTLRRALGESAEAPRFIVTVARDGYRFVGDVRAIDGSDASEDRLGIEQADVPVPISDAGTNRLTTALSILACALILTAAIVAVEAVSLLPVHSSSRSFTLHAIDPEAQRLYLRGRFYWAQGYDNPSSLELARGCFLRAVDRDPQFAPAHAGLAMTYGSMAVRHMLPPERAYRDVKLSAARALAIDGSLAEAHYASGAAAFRFDWDWATAETELRRAIELDPSFAEAHQLYGDFLANMGRYDEAIHETSRAVDLDPLWGIFSRSHGRALAAAGRIDEAISEYRRALARDPNSYRLYLRLAELYERKAMYDETIGLRARAESLAVGHAEPNELVGYPEDAEALDRNYRARGFPDAVREMYRAKLARLGGTPGQYISSFTLATIYCRLGDEQDAAIALEHAAAERDSELIALRLYPEFAGILRLPQLRRIAEALKIPTS